jgi:hypothetical protein
LQSYIRTTRGAARSTRARSSSWRWIAERAAR